uniref:Uncharacterized protein n=1 Tax=Quercus lobata TaxID=97700 RepID=A0A7N2KQX0_QUELO
MSPHSNGLAKTSPSTHHQQFWQDRWCGETSLAVTYPKLFRFCQDKEASVVELMKSTNGVLYRNVSFFTGVHARELEDDQKVVTKRKTELGGTFSIASWILFIGLFAALLYQTISKRSVEVHNIRATNAPDLASFVNDMELNITTISSMSCSNLRGLDTLVTGNPGFIDERFSPLSGFANYSCHNTSQGPTINLRCSPCKLIQDNLYISWQFVDLSNNPATAVGFQFNLTARNQANKKHVSFVCGTLKNGSSFDDKPVTFRGRDANILKFNLFPRIYRNLHDLRLIQPLFHEFLPGSSLYEASQLHASLENSNDGLINTTLYVNLLSAYIVEINNQNIMGPGFGDTVINIVLYLWYCCGSTVGKQGQYVFVC